MKDYTTNGTIVTHPVNPHSYEEGLTGLVIVGNQIYIVTLTHCDKEGNWVVTGEYDMTLSRGRSLFTFKVSVKTGLISISVKDWPYIIKENIAGKAGIKFNIKPYKFKSGKHIQTCSECYSIFEASPNQPYCEKCCSGIHAVAYLNDKVKEKIFTFDEQFVRHIAQWSLVNGYNQVDHIEFNQALNKEIESYKNGSNITKSKPKG